MVSNDFNVIGVVGRHDKPMIVDSLQVVLQTLKRVDRSARIEAQTASLLTDVEADIISRQELGSCDLVVVVGATEASWGLLATWQTPKFQS